MSPAAAGAAANPRRLLLVHAHPDDESITTGATIARYVAEGAAVTVVTCTLGEEGEVLVPRLAQLSAGQADQLGGHRLHEMAAAMRALGVSDHRWLGGAGRFRDSGMAGQAANGHPRAFWRAADDPAVFAEAVGHLVRIIRQVRPHAVVTYDPNGGYGHPDHVMAHRVTTAALASAARPAEVGAGSPGAGARVPAEGSAAWSAARLYWIVASRSAVAEELAQAARHAPADLRRVGADELPTVPDAEVTTVVDARDHLDAQAAALGAHATQVVVRGRCYALSNGIARYLTGLERYRRVLGERLGAVRADGLEDGLFPDAGTP
ncbi:MAG: N-acetyl-1-D-myo-inositol-2-amino-2-deoxy-alpha-D-glucopyranoside deacetylase [Frankiaceae bacterium]|jgi:N-acetyl-1-D-myo-inositol-2-amino-2-deoxy-alpha-D-glucopyranoside deacetylase|nr:N-acetyl-1-D-myo-inositol-2-amino-2-deoxy-alpha-D-glucopyranoside deacetylase [Frankiaceae bacterium]